MYSLQVFHSWDHANDLAFLSPIYSEFYHVGAVMNEHGCDQYNMCVESRAKFDYMMFRNKLSCGPTLMHFQYSTFGVNLESASN